jgi:hypothetical protein
MLGSLSRIPVWVKAGDFSICDLERVDVISDLSILIDIRMTFVGLIGSCVSRLARMLGFIKQILKEFNDPYTYKTLYVAFVFNKHAISFVQFFANGPLFLRDSGDLQKRLNHLR